jgi:hypothetical protein
MRHAYMQNTNMAYDDSVHGLSQAHNKTSPGNYLADYSIHLVTRHQYIRRSFQRGEALALAFSWVISRSLLPASPS